jgi:hypothetical protein
VDDVVPLWEKSISVISRSMLRIGQNEYSHIATGIGETVYLNLGRSDNNTGSRSDSDVSPPKC